MTSVNYLNFCLSEYLFVLLSAAIVFVYDIFPGAETVLLKHFSGPGGMNGYTNAFNMEGGSSSRSYNSSNKGTELCITLKLSWKC